jgi:hypothetical protein
MTGRPIGVSLAYGLDRWRVSDKVLLGSVRNAWTRNATSVTSTPRPVPYAPHGSFSHVTPRAAVCSATDGVDLFAVSGLYRPPTNFELEDEGGTNAIAMP